MPDKVGRLNGQEQTFIERFAASGDRAYAAEKAGYVQPHAAASKLLAREPVRDAVAARIAEHRVKNAEAAFRLLGEVIADPKYPVQHRVTAARIAITDYRAGEAQAADSKDPAEMNGDELHRRIARLQAEVAARAVPVLELEAQEVEDNTADAAAFE